MEKYDVTVLTDSRYVAPKVLNDYKRNVLWEDRLISEALIRRGLAVHRTHWDDKNMDWSSTHFALFRTTWDYFDRIVEFREWFKSTREQTQFINPADMILHNMDKHYLKELAKAGLPIPPTLFIAKGTDKSLAEHLASTDWKEVIIKPAISGAARHTYRISLLEIPRYESLFSSLIANEGMLIQEFQSSILDRGEVAFMVFGGKFSHAILKVAKPGDFRVQDDFGGSVHRYSPTPQEIEQAEAVVASCPVQPVYARVDMMWDDRDRMMVSELELIEPELWMRMHPPAAEQFADAVVEFIG